MKKKQRNWLLKIFQSEAFSYLFFGLLTTVVNYTVFIVGLSAMGQEAVLSVNIIAFLVATIFAYLTNKVFVFHKQIWNVREIFAEIWKFTSARVFSLLIEQLGLYVSAEWLELGEQTLLSVNCLVIAKVLLSFVSVCLNYFASKFVVFKKEKS